MSLSRQKSSTIRIWIYTVLHTMYIRIVGDLLMDAPSRTQGSSRSRSNTVVPSSNGLGTRRATSGTHAANIQPITHVISHWNFEGSGSMLQSRYAYSTRHLSSGHPDIGSPGAMHMHIIHTWISLLCIYIVFEY